MIFATATPAPKKGDLASAAEKICAGTAIIEAEVRAKAIAWVPDVMLFGEASTAAVAAPGDDGGAVTSDAGAAEGAAAQEPGDDADEERVDADDNGLSRAA